MRSRPWTLAEREVLAAGILDGLSYSEIAASLGRTRDQVAGEAARLALAPVGR